MLAVWCRDFDWSRAWWTALQIFWAIGMKHFPHKGDSILMLCPIGNYLGAYLPIYVQIFLYLFLTLYLNIYQPFPLPSYNLSIIQTLTVICRIYWCYNFSINQILTFIWCIYPV